MLSECSGGMKKYATVNPPAAVVHKASSRLLMLMTNASLAAAARTRKLQIIQAMYREYTSAAGQAIVAVLHLQRVAVARHQRIQHRRQEHRQQKPRQESPHDHNRKR